MSAVAKAEMGARYWRYLAGANDTNKIWSGYMNAYSTREIRVVDVAFIFKLEGDAPVYKARLLPHNFTPSEIAGWPSYLTGFYRDSKQGPRHYISVRLPKDRTLSTEGYLETDWTLCPDCLGIKEGRFPSLNLLKAFEKYAKAPATQQNISSLAFKDQPDKPIIIGEAVPERAEVISIAMREKIEADRLAAEKAAEEKRLAAERAAEEERLYGDARRAYKSFAKEHKRSPLATDRNSQCGSLNLQSVPNYRRANARDYERGMEENLKRFEKHVNCVTKMLETADYVTYAEAAGDALNREEALWAAANLPEGDRINIASVEAMVQQEQQYLKGLVKSFEKRAKAYERGFDDYAKEQERRARAEAKRERDRIVKREKQNCLMGLAARGALTLYSDGYCEAQAKKGISGHNAALIGSAGSTTPAPSYNPSPIPSFDEIAKFDLQGMIDNARVAAATNNPNVLWDESGRIRNHRAPQIANIDINEIERKARERRKNISRTRPNSTSSTASTDTNEALARARAASEEVSRSSSTESETAETTMVDTKAEADKAAREEKRRLEQEAREAERQKRERERQLAQEKREREKARRQAIKDLRESIQPIRGGLQGCVEVLKERRVPGSSAHSSCSYNEPDRKALYITYFNRCEVPVNIEMNILYDTGENRDTGEYDIKTGKQRTTAGYCGAMNHTWRYVETSSSLEKRRDEAVRLSGLNDPSD